MTDKKLPLRKRRNNTPEENLRRIAALKRKQSQIAEQIDKRQAELLEQMDAAEITKLEYRDEDEDVLITGTLVRGETVTMDETALKKKVGASVWNKISTSMLDRKKLDVAIQAGDVSETDVAASAVIKQRKPFVKVTLK